MLNEPDETTEMVLQSGAEISRMLEHRNKALLTIRAARAQAEQALDHACAALGGKDLLLRRETFGYLGYKSHDRSLEEYRAQLDRSLWLRVFDVTKLASLMGSKQRSKFYKDLDAQVPEFNEVNLRATFEHVHLTGAAIFKQTVRDLFEQLRPRFKSHKGFGFGERLIFESALEWGVSSLFYEDILLDLMTVCAGCPHPVLRSRQLGHCAREVVTIPSNTYEKLSWHIDKTPWERIAHSSLLGLRATSSSMRARRSCSSSYDSAAYSCSSESMTCLIKTSKRSCSV